MKKEDRAKKVSLAISLVREKGDQFPASGFSTLLKYAGCPYPARVPSILQSLGLIKREGQMYRFIKPEPIYFRQLESKLDTIAKQYVKKQTTKLKPLVSDEQAMINLLKSKGYKILSPVTKYVEC
jgi:hypothetical protein